MCILCVIQKCSRKVATLLPWLLIPLIGLWFLSQFLPPAFRFQITSPRLACVLVLLSTLFWYEILVPHITSWRAHRTARLKEKKRLEAIELQRRRKSATRRCRNCKTPYRDQNPSGGKFMCCYCGHLSKRPLFDSSVSTGLRPSGLGFFKHYWGCFQDWLENCGSCLMGLFRMTFSEDDEGLNDGMDVDGLAKKGENGNSCNESRSEKARRKAEEKRVARLEREQLEEEERKQREEVARLVEERRKLRDEVDKRSKAVTRDKNDKREGERKRQERKKENADEVEKRASKEVERKFKGDKSKVITTDSYNKGSIGAQYLDRMRGKFLPSSRTMAGGFFGKGMKANANASNNREHKSSGYLDHANKRDFVHPERVHGKSNAHATDQNQNRHAVFESQPCPPPKRSWHQLFTRSSPPVSSTSTNVVSRPSPNENPQTESQSPKAASSGFPVTRGFDNPISYGSPFSLSHGDSTSNTGQQFSGAPVHRDVEKYEDPTFVADYVSYIEPGSDSLDSFPIDLGFLADAGSGDETPADSVVFPTSPAKTNDKEWQMWNSSFSPDALGLVGVNRNWQLPQQPTTTTSNGPWALRSSYGSFSSNNNCLSTNQPDTELVYGTPNVSAFNYPFQPSNSSFWAKKEMAGGSVCVEGIGSTSALIPPGDGGLYSMPAPLQMYSPFGHVNEKENE